jgi:hypothetical protein
LIVGGLAVKTLEPIKADWKWGSPEGSRELDRLLDRQLTFCEKLEWLEEAETLSLRLRARRAVATAEAGESRIAIE